MSKEFEEHYGAPAPDVIPLASKFGPGDYIGVDLDGTWARWDGWTKWNVIGDPFPAMTARVKAFLAAGVEVRVFTARVGSTEAFEECKVTGEGFFRDQMVTVVQDWTEKVVGVRLAVQAHKDNHMKEFFDDRAVQMVPNTGRTLAEEHEAQLNALRGAP